MEVQRYEYMNTTFFQGKDKAFTILLCMGIFYVLALPLILFNINYGRAFDDQKLFHYPTILHFIQSLDFSDYPSATTPGYHVLLGFVGQLFSSNEIILKLTSSAFTAALIGIIVERLYSHFGKLHSILLSLPMILSIYIFPSGVWLLPDNLAWLTVLGVFIIATKSELLNKHFLYLAFILILAMMVRQPFLWLASTIWASALAYYSYNTAELSDRGSFLLKGVLATLPAFAIFYYFYVLWGGLVPPSFQNSHQNISLATPAFFLSVFAFYSLFFLPVMYGTIRDVISSSKFKWVMFGCVIGFIIAVIPDTSYSKELGRYSGLWNFVKIAPTIADKSTFIMLLSSLGGGLFVLFCTVLPPRIRLIFALSTIAFVFSLMPNKYVFERYMSGYIFIFIYCTLCHIKLKNNPLPAVVAWSGPVIFAAFNGLVLVRSMLA